MCACFPHSTIMQHSQSDISLGTKQGSWADIKHAEGMKKRSNTAQNLQFYGALPPRCGLGERASERRSNILFIVC